MWNRINVGGGTLFILLMLLLGGCQQQGQHSRLFEKIFLPEKGGLLRGINLGMSLQEVKKIEGIAPKHDDKWGYVYELNLSEKGRFFLEYICKKSDNRIVSSIVINIFLKDEGITSELYSEMEAALRADYGLAEGSSTNLEWQESEQNLYITLRVLDDKKSISLNYVNIGGF